jgi:class 3 adenylate cyclase/predicted ATPase
VDVGAWLRQLGLERYESAFQDQEIDWEVLPELSEADLERLGIPLGPRKKLLKAIAMLAAAGAPAAPKAEAKRTTIAPQAAERRQLTVMFVDLVGSTVLAARLDPEEMGEVLRAYQAAVAGEVARFGGHVAKYMGDGVLAYFGWPAAYEDAAERAVRAGLAVLEVVGRLQAPEGSGLAARVGIATGLVVVGELTGEGAAQEHAVVGETPNLAARLQALAEPGSVVIGANTRRLLGALFELADLGVHALKGFPKPVPAWRVLGPGRAEGRFEARQQPAGVTPLVGRAQELALLLEGWQRAKAGAGQVVLLSGEAGIGKSRLVQALRERLAAEPHTALRYQCSPYHTTSPLHPVIEQLERAAGLQRDDPGEVRLDKLEALLGATGGDGADIVPLLAPLLGIPTGERYPPLDLTPQRQRERTLLALLAQLVGLAARQPVLVLLEDAHWIDPTTRELFDLTVERVRDLPALVVVTFRPEFRPPWAGHGHVRPLSLTRLSRQQGAAMVERVAGGRLLPAEVAAQIVAKTDGVPLFVEELTKAVLESGLLREEDDRYALAGPLSPPAIPSTLQDSLLARLDRLAPVREVAQIASVLGREFPFELLAAVAPQDEAALGEAMAQLCAAELVFCRGTPPAATYSFKHALIQDAAYQSLLKSRRQQLHARIVGVLEERFPETAEAEPELLAHHCAQAGLVEKASTYWHEAGQQAIRRSALAEAVTHLTTALELLAGFADGPERRRQEFELQVTLGGALMQAKGWASPEMGRAYARARDLCREADDAPQLFPVLHGLRQLHLNRAEMDAAQAVSEELLRLAETQDHPAVRLLGHLSVGISLLFRAEFAAALEHLEQVVAGYDPLRHRTFTDYGAADLRVSGRSFTAWALLFQGHLNRALAQSQQALAVAREVGRPYTSAFALHVNCLFHQVRGDRAVVEERSAALMARAAEQGFPHLLGTGTFFHGWARAESGDATAGIEEMRRGLAGKQATGAEIKVPYYLGLLARTYAGTGRQADAVALLDDALERVERTGERWFEAELHRLRGEVLLRSPEHKPAAAEVCFRRALEVAQRQAARLWELRAASSLARLWSDRSKRAEAHDLLAPVYGLFTEGFETKDLKEAKALLDALA